MTVHELTKQTLERGYLMSLAIVDTDGPWVADVIFIHDDDFNIYWMSSTDRRHSRAIDSGHDRVAGTITVTQRSSDPDEGLQISGTAQRIDYPSAELLQRWMMKKGKLAPEGLLVLKEHVWYKLVPDRIELIHQTHFDYNRQRVIP